MSIAQDPAALKQQMQALLGQLQTSLDDAAHAGQPIHAVEQGIFRQVLQLGRQCLAYFLALHGDGDQGPSVTAADGRPWRRLGQPHRRHYVSIFGRFELERVAHGRREGQKIAFVPLDNRLQLPAGAYSYLLQDWAQALAVESAFGPVAATLERLFGLRLSVDNLERMNRQMAGHVAAYRADRTPPAAAAEGELLVASADGKGVVMRRAADDPAAAAHRSKGAKASQKRMAIVASVYTVDRHVRTAEDVVAALFRDGPAEPAAERPVPRHKHVWASLTAATGEGVVSGIDRAHEAMMGEVIERNRRAHAWLRPMVFLNDGQESLWEARQRHLPPEGIDVLDLLHVTPRRWQAAHAFHAEGSAAAEAFVRERCLRVLQGRAEGVIRGLREMATKAGLSGARKRTITQVCGYLEKNRHRMRYDAYLAAGYPIASGVIEGACRHLVKDRMERAGMHWTVAGAQAMLEVRSVHVDGEWEAYQAYRIDRELHRLYPHRSLVEGTQYTLAA